MPTASLFSVVDALTAIKSHVENNIWCVFGCGGQRDTGKRPLMGEVAGQLSDRIVLTADNARNETVASINADIQRGIQSNANVTVIEDRKQAIRHTIGQANVGDIILLAGKGHETYQDINGQRIDYDERAFVAQVLEELKA